MTDSSAIQPLIRRYIEDAGHTSQSIGVGRVIGQIYAYLYFSPEPRSLADMQEALGISKGSASMGVRQLEQWAAVRKVWVRGDRKDYYEANDWIGKVVKNALVDVIGRKLALANGLLAETEDTLAGLNGPDAGFIRQRLERLRRFQRRTQTIWNSAIVQRLLR